MRYMVNGAETEITGNSSLECDYCGQGGHTYRRHPEALQDEREWQHSRTDEETWEPRGRAVAPVSPVTIRVSTLAGHWCGGCEFCY